MEYTFAFPAIRGVQARREYFVSMCPLRIIPRIFLFDEEELGPEFRAQRTLNTNRVPEIARYIVNNPDDYVFSALTASVDGDIEFEAVSDDGAALQRLGTLKIPMTSRFIINDGQHRRAAIEAALRENPQLGNETIAVVFFLDAGLKRSQQMFADLNRHAVRPSKSLGVLYDHRDGTADLTRQVVFQSDLFRKLVELERASLSLRSRKLFTLSSIHTATEALVAGLDHDSYDDLVSLAVEFWEEAANHMEEWQLVLTNKITAGEVHRDYISSKNLVLEALGRVGNQLLKTRADDWKDVLRRLEGIDWSRANGKVWEGRALSGGRVVKSRQNVLLTTNYLKKRMELPLSDLEQSTEDAHLRGDHGQ